MAKRFLDEIGNASFVLLQLDQPGAVFVKNENSSGLQIHGGIELRVKDSDGVHADLQLLQLGLFGESVGEIHVGEISVAGRSGGGTIQVSGGELTSIAVEFSAFLLYDAIISARGYPNRRDDILLSPWEEWMGTLSGVIELVEDSPLGHTSWQIRDGVLTIQPSPNSKIFGLVNKVSVSLAGVAVPMLTKGAPNGCPNGSAAFKRTLNIRPVFFERVTGGVTGASIIDQFNAVRKIWGPCCIEFNVLDPHIITNQEINARRLRRAVDDGDPDKIADIYSDAAGIVEIFFVDNKLASYGGGATLNGGMSQVKIVITDNNSDNPRLLAHEIGHAFDGDHPLSKDPHFWPADKETVLKPGKPNPEDNTINNCRMVKNPALVSGKPPISCCMNPIKR